MAPIHPSPCVQDQFILAAFPGNSFQFCAALEWLPQCLIRFPEFKPKAGIRKEKAFHGSDGEFLTCSAGAEGGIQWRISAVYPFLPGHHVFLDL